MMYSDVLKAFQNKPENPNDRVIAFREGWNGANQYIGMCTSWNGDVIVDSQDFKMVPFLYIKTTQNLVVPWVPSQTDNLAADWEIQIVPTEPKAEATQADSEET